MGTAAVALAGILFQSGGSAGLQRGVAAIAPRPGLNGCAIGPGGIGLRGSQRIDGSGSRVSRGHFFAQKDRRTEPVRVESGDAVHWIRYQPAVFSGSAKRGHSRRGGFLLPLGDRHAGVRTREDAGARCPYFRHRSIWG